MENELQFDPEKHEYKVNGEKLINVTSLVSIYGDDIDFQNENLEVPFEFARERGTLLHKLFEMLWNNENIDGEYPSEYSPYVEAMIKFIAENQITPIAIEKPICSESQKVAGTPDLLCLFADDLDSEEKVAIIDYKFVAQVAKTKVKAQLNFYHSMYSEQGIDVERLIAVQFLKTGDYRKYNCAIDKKEVALALDVYEAKNKKHNRGEIN